MNAEQETEQSTALQGLQDRAEIGEVIDRYAEGIRRRDVSLVTSCFSESAAIDHGPGRQIAGSEAIREYFARSFNPDTETGEQAAEQRAISTPVMSNLQIQLAGDTAHCESMCLAIHVSLLEGDAAVTVRGTRNVDDLVRTSEGWKIQARRHPALWMFKVPGTLLANPSEII
ncbi:MAG: nuclear transport factor 2 family protein [Acidimicrobiales bacterium]